MRMTSLFLRTLRDDPADAEVDSHRLLVRAGYIRRVSAGIYAWLPLGYRVLRKIEQIVREEMDAAGAQEALLPIAQPLELWQRTGREKAYGPLMFRLQDRKETQYCLSPTAEEVVTTIVAQEYGSYRDLPLNLYQINWKYRDELRPRFGLLRGREFLMKDAYSFDLDLDGLKQSYRAMYDAYSRVFERCGLTFRAVEAQSGEMGGSESREFMAVAAVGEDDFVWCRNCDYAANVEAARRDHTRLHAAVPAVDGEIPPMEEVDTPDLPGIAGVSEFLGVPPAAMLKCIAFETDGKLGLALVPGDREVNEYALAAAVAPRSVRLYNDEDFAKHPELPKGYIGPHFAGADVVVADPSVRAEHGWVTGANRVDHHVKHALLGRDFTVDIWADLVTIVTGDPCPLCGSELSVDRGIEVGHVFQLGTKYTEALDCTYTDAQGEEHPMVMGCYGIGVSRVLAAVAEEFHDEHGLAWPRALAPYDVHLIAVPGRGEQAEAVMAEAERVYEELQRGGLAVLFDDRDVSPGVKFADADLVGVPVQLVVGAKGVGRGVVERKVRASGERDELPLQGLTSAVVDVSG
ncbi:MAG TPA: proline--tRNA ligase [Acidimicrobiia bacterium]|jgi:prolyl-tRNA synthetase|nr:proline--tRNA ligase [Acidimicrobiia bacterium]